MNKENLKSKQILRIDNLKVYFPIRSGIARFQTGSIKAVDGISFEIFRGETLGLVGESGCGKSVVSLSIMGLIPNPPGEIKNGDIRFGNKNLLKLSQKEMQAVRGNEIAMIFQEPMTSLNPIHTCGRQIREPLLLHGLMKKKKLLQNL